MFQKILNLIKKGLNMSLKYYELPQDEINKFQYAKLTSNRGTIWIKLFPKDAPNTVANFQELANSGFYNGLNFHRVIDGFMAQGGCPQGTGTGGPGWKIPCETALSDHKHNRGALSMAHAGPNTGGSQFFICFVGCPHLNGVHTVFGQIEEDDEESFKVLDSVQMFDKIESIEVVESK
jgi:cyclophilin family peptidyl-prolyl cis-trans isomerase